MPGLLLPGLINGHAHSPMTILRGAGEGLPLDRWLREAIWPREARLHPEDVADGMALGAAEMLLNGVTTSNEMYFFPEAVAAGALRAGLRCVVGAAIIEGLERFGSPAQQVDEALSLAAEVAGEDLLEVALAPHSAYAVGDAHLCSAAEAAAERDLSLHIHVAETAAEGDGVTARTGRTVPRHLFELGILEGRVLAAHCVWLNDDDIALFAETGVGAAHCPGSNGKLGSGIAPVRSMRRAGMAVAVGTDGPASNDNLDLLEEVRLALLYSRLRDHDASALTALEALGLATSEAAAALGRSDIGALVPGRWADIVHVDLDRPEYGPLAAPEAALAHLVWGGSSRDVTDVWVGGRRVVEEGRLLTMALDEARARVAAVARRVGA
jgi:5-methylthioadenosine/S-adenosylhomocysteine deaminase